MVDSAAVVRNDAAVSSPPSIGICEDDDELRGVLRNVLRRDGYEVFVTSTGGDAVRAFSADPPDVLVLDIGLPDADGRDVCQALRAHQVHSPVLFLTARDALADRLSGFHAGGDDYLSKPFALAELLVRIRALSHRAPPEPPADPGGLVLDPVAHALRFDGREARLTPTEFRIIACLAARPGVIVRRHTVVSAAWPHGAMVQEHTLDACMTRIRGKLRELDAPQAIETLRGVGYRLDQVPG